MGYSFRSLATAGGLAMGVAFAAGAASASAIIFDSNLLPAPQSSLIEYKFEGDHQNGTFEPIHAEGVWSVLGKVGNMWTLSVDLSVISTGTARLVSFGFDSEPELASASLVSNVPDDLGWDWGITTSTNFPGFQTVDACAFAGNNCSGGGNAGLTNPVTTAGGNTRPPESLVTFNVTTTEASETLTLSGFYVRFQSAPLVGGGSTSITFQGHPPSPIPLPAAGWLLLGGIGALAAVRRRKKAA